VGATPVRDAVLVLPAADLASVDREGGQPDAHTTSFVGEKVTTARFARRRRRRTVGQSFPAERFRRSDMVVTARDPHAIGGLGRGEDRNAEESQA
jgi:hypothetical protein